MDPEIPFCLWIPESYLEWNLEKMITMDRSPMSAQKTALLNQYRTRCSKDEDSQLTKNSTKEGGSDAGNVTPESLVERSYMHARTDF